MYVILLENFESDYNADMFYCNTLCLSHNLFCLGDPNSDVIKQNTTKASNSRFIK